MHSRVAEQLREAKARAPVGPQVTGVQQLLAVSFDQQARESGAEWSTGMAVTDSEPKRSGSPRAAA